MLSRGRQERDREFRGFLIPLLRVRFIGPIRTERISCAIPENWERTENRDNRDPEDRRCQWLGCACDPYIFVPRRINRGFSLGPSAAPTNTAPEARMLPAA